MKSATFINILFVKTFNHICTCGAIGAPGDRCGELTPQITLASERFSYLKCFWVNAKNSCFLGKNHDEYSFDWKLRWSLQIWFLDDNFPIQDSPTAMSWKWLARRAYRPAIFTPPFLQCCLGVAVACCCHKMDCFSSLQQKNGGIFLGAFQSVAVYSRQITCLRARGMATCECVDDVSFKLKLSYNRLGQNGGIIIFIFMVPVYPHQWSIFFSFSTSRNFWIECLFFHQKFAEFCVILFRSNCCSTII